ncbi:MAG TPA: hypothetical protein PLB62_10365, partial [Candidatus Sumerlaeota bacterium]|nr:hypothetical protein [Candidatus Sumerlaeota bacterium]
RAMMACALLLAPLLAAAGDILLNPGLETDADSNGYPDQWIFQRRAIPDDDPLDAFEGRFSARAARRHALIQGITPFPLTFYAFSGFAHGETGREHASLNAEFREDARFLHYQSGSWPAATEFTPWTTSLLAPPDSNVLNVIFTARYDPDWVSGDTFSLLDEFISNPGFEIPEQGNPAGWFQSGNPIYEMWGGRTLQGPATVRGDGEYFFYQDLAASSFRAYALSFYVRTDQATITPEALRVDFFSEDGSSCGNARIPFEAGPAFHQVTGTFTPTSPTVSMRISLRPDEGARTPLWFDDLALYGLTTSPQTFSPNGDDIQDTCTISILLPHEANLSLDILAAEGGLIRGLAQNEIRPAGIASTAWDGTTESGEPVSPGEYIVRAEIQMPGNEQETVTETTVRVNGLPPAENTVAPMDHVFPRGAWIHLGGRYGEALDYSRHFHDLKDAGFDTVIAMWHPEERTTEVLDAAEAAGLRLIIQPRDVYEAVSRRPDFHPERMDEAAVRTMTAAWRDRTSTYTCVLGWYVQDEAPPEKLLPVREAVRLFRNAVPERPAFSSISMVNDLAARREILDTAVLMHHYYPLFEDTPTAPSSFDAFCADLREASHAAHEAGRPLWMILQGFAEEGAWRPPTEAELRCMTWLSLAHGARGVFHFLSNSLYGLRGLYSFEGQPLPILDEAKTLNTQIESLTDVLLNLDPREDVLSPPADHTVTAFRDTADVPYIIVVNRDCLTTRTAEIPVPFPGVTDVRDVLTEGALPFHDEGHRTLIQTRLAPGAGALLRITVEEGRGEKDSGIPREVLFSAFSLPRITPFPQEPTPAEQPPVPVEPAGILALSGTLKAVAAAGDGALVAAWQNRLYVIDAAFMELMRVIHTMGDNFYYSDAVFDGERAYFADPTGGMGILEKDLSGRFARVGEWW